MEDDLVNFKQVKQSAKFHKLIEAMKMKSMRDNEVWDLVKWPEDVKLIGSNKIFKTERDSKGNIEKYKSRLVAHGYSQIDGIEYKKTFSPISLKDSFRTIMALVAHFVKSYTRGMLRKLFLVVILMKLYT